MSVIKSILARLYRDERGATMVEYSLLVGLITIAAVTTIGLVSDEVGKAWVSLHTAFTS